MRVPAAAAAFVLLLGVQSAEAKPAVPDGATKVFALSDSRIDEASGIAAGIRSPGVYYVQNDSGDSARFFAVDAHTGRTDAVYDVPGAKNVDWEDLAVARDADAVPSVWLADIGDNDAKRTSVQIYRVDEPNVADGSGPASAPETWNLTYPDGPRDAESLAVGTGGAMYIFSKSKLGATNVYSVPRSSDGGRRQVMTKIGSIHFDFTGTPDALSPFGQLTATGAALAADGSLLVVRTYTDAYVWPVTGGDVAAALKGHRTVFALPEQPQGEGITLVGDHVVIDSEHVGSSVYSVPLPPLPSPTESNGGPTQTQTFSLAPSVNAGTNGGEPNWTKWTAVAIVAILLGFLLIRLSGHRGRRPQ